MGFYILDENGEPKEADYLEWTKWVANDIRRLLARIGDVKISTVFLGLDHYFFGDKPVLWETNIFGGEHDGYQERYSSKEDALKGHKKACDLVRREI
jgi:hypothetical protein